MISWRKQQPLSEEMLLLGWLLREFMYWWAQHLRCHSVPGFAKSSLTGLVCGIYQISETCRDIINFRGTYRPPWSSPPLMWLGSASSVMVSSSGGSCFFPRISVRWKAPVVAGARRTLGHGTLLLWCWLIIWVTLTHFHNFIADAHAHYLPCSLTLTAGYGAL